MQGYVNSGNLRICHKTGICRIWEIDNIQHNGQGEVQIDEYEENSMRMAEGTAIGEALTWVRIVQQTQKVVANSKYGA